MKRSLTANFIFSIINTLTGLLFPLITFPYITHIFLAEDVGLVNYYNSIISYVLLLTGIGIPSYATKQIAILSKDKREQHRQAVEIMLLHLMLTIVGYLIIIIIPLFVNNVNQNVCLFYLLSIQLLFNTLGCEWFFKGTEDFKYIAIRSFILRLICVFLLFIFVKDRSDLYSYGIYTVLVSVGSNIFNFIKIQKVIDYRIIDFKELCIFRHVKPSVLIFGLSLITSLYLNLDTVMLGLLGDNSSVGYYSTAIKLPKTLMSLSTALTFVLLPRLSALAIDNNHEGFMSLVKKSVEVIIFISVPLVIYMEFLADDLILLLCGKNYYPSIVCMQILTPILLFIGTSYVVAQIFYPLNKLKYMYISALSASSMNVILNIFLIPLYKENGAALATLFAEFTSLIVYIYCAYKILNIKLIGARNLFDFIIAIIVMILIILLTKQFDLSIIYEIILTCVLGFTSYLCSLYILKNKILYDISSKLKLLISCRKI